MEYTIRKASLADASAIEKLVALSARGLSKEYTSEQVEGALRGAFGVETQLIEDETYFVVEANGMLVGCGGWSKRKTLFGGDKHTERDAKLLDPNTDPAKIRAFFVHPAWARKGIGRAILAQCESEVRANGFRSLELMSTLPGLKLYSACGYVAGERVTYELTSGLTIEFVPMNKVLNSDSTAMRMKTNSEQA